MPIVALNSEGHFARIRDLQQAYSGLRQDLPLLDQRIEFLRADLTHVDEHVAVPPGPWTMSRAEAECNLGAALHERFMHLRGAEDLTGAERHLRLAVLHSHGDAPFPGPDSLLGSVLRERAYETKSLELAEEALSLHRQPVPMGTSAHPVQRAHYNRELGLTLQIYQSLSKSEDSVLLEGIERLRTARALYADADVVDHLSAFGLCMTYAVLFEIRMKKPDFEEALSYGVLALNLSGPLHRDYYLITWAVSHIRSMLVWRFGDGDEMTLRDINDTIRTALDHAPSGWAIRLVVRLCFTVGLEHRLSKHSRDEDLSDAIGRVTTILAGLDAADSQWDNLQGSLSSALYDRFRTTGTPESIEAAAHAASLALSRAIPGSPPHMFRLSHYAVCRAAQHESFGDIAHSNECISLLELMVSLAPLQGIQRQMAIRTMLGALQQRYRDTGDLSDLNRAIELVPLSIEHVDKKGGYSPEVLHDAGTAFLSRFELTGSLGDLEQATSFLREAMEGCADDPYDKHHKIVSAYSKVLRMRYEVLHDDKSMAQALELQTKLLPALSEAHPNRTHALCGLACIKLCKGAEDGDANVEEAFKCLLDAMDNAYCPVYRRLKEVTDVLTYMNTHVPRLTRENALKLSLVYSTAIDLLPQVASFGLEPRVRLAVIAGAGQLTTRAAIHAISLGQLDLALQMLESGRSVFWTQGLHLRTPFSNLPSAIGERLAAITYALARPFPENLDGAGKDRELARRRQLGADFLSTLSEARMVPGFEQLLRNPSFTSLVKAAERHPVVVFVAGETSSHALILLEDGQCREVALAKATVKTLRTLSLRIESHTKLVRSSRGMRQSKPTGPSPSEAYRELWTSVMLPIVDALCLPRAQGRQRRRLTLCPTGVFMQLPLHAAGVYTGADQVCCSDYFVSSYTPSISALLHAQRSYQPLRCSEAELLLVAVHRPLQGVPLPMTTKEAETVQRHVSPSSKVVQASTCQGALEHIQSASILHLACHGTQNPVDALESGFHLEDGLLPVSKLMELELPRAFLAVLSACETAKGDAAQPDQAIHLAAAMLFAGFKSVVATMWSMGDSEGPVVAESIYSAIFKDGESAQHLDLEEVPYALDEAVRGMRQSGLDPSFWATYVHIGI